MKRPNVPAGRSCRSLAGAFLAVVLATPSFAEASPPPTGPSVAAMSVDEIVACMRRNTVDRGSLRRLDVTVTDREGKIRSLAMKLFWKPSDESKIVRATLRVTEPEDVAGMAYLVRGKATGADEEVYVYLPSIGRPQRVVGSEANQQLWGTDFTYAEIQQVQGLLQQGHSTRAADATAFDRPAYVVETDTDTAVTGYDRVVSYVDRQTCALLKSEIFAADGKRLKRLEADLDTMLEVEPWWLVLSYTMYDEARGSKTRLDMSDVYLLEDLPESLFLPESFHQIDP